MSRASAGRKFRFLTTKTAPLLVNQLVGSWCGLDFKFSSWCGLPSKTNYFNGCQPWRHLAGFFLEFAPHAKMPECPMRRCRWCPYFFWAYCRQMRWDAWIVVLHSGIEERYVSRSQIVRDPVIRSCNFKKILAKCSVLEADYERDYEQGDHAQRRYWDELLIPENSDSPHKLWYTSSKGVSGWSHGACDRFRLHAFHHPVKDHSDTYLIPFDKIFPLII